ncbi:MAG TPA: Fe-S cluster assembly protein HesB, partial [Acidimicrobiales bacterium]
MASLHLSQESDADALISDNPLALLIGMVLDQQMPLERAFAAPRLLQERLGFPLDAADIAAMDPEALVAAFVARPALHRFPAANAKR